MIKILGVGLLATLIGFAAVSDWQSLLGISLAGFWALVAGVILYRWDKQLMNGRWLGKVLVTGLVVRLFASFLHLAVGLWFYGGKADFVQYHEGAVYQAERFLRGDLIHIEQAERKTEFRLLEHFLGLAVLLVGPGLVGMVLFSGVLGFIACYLFLRAFQVEFPEARGSRFLALALFFLPTMVFWGGYPGKDAWIMLFLGWVTYCFTQVLHKLRLSHLLGIAFSLASLLMIRWPVGGIVTLTLSVAWLIRKTEGPAAMLRPIGFALCPLVLAGVTSYMGSFILPRPISLVRDFGAFVDVSAETAALVHKGYSYGGSARAIEITDRSLGGVLNYLPSGSFAFLFRPMIFEAHHSLAVFAALEATFFLGLIIWRWRSLVAAVRLAFSRPFIGLCALTFMLLISILAVETNFGAIVRHRAMVLPFLLIMLAVPPNRKRQEEKGGDGAIPPTN